MEDRHGIGRVESIPDILISKKCANEILRPLKRYGGKTPEEVADELDIQLKNVERILEAEPLFGSYDLGFKRRSVAYVRMSHRPTLLEVQTGPGQPVFGKSPTYTARSQTLLVLAFLYLSLTISPSLETETFRQPSMILAFYKG